MYNKHYYFIGIGGIGMSGLALIALEKGAMVSGSDTVHSYITSGLQKKEQRSLLDIKKSRFL